MSRRHDPDVVAADAARALADPVYQRSLEAAEEALVDSLAMAKDDGSARFDDWERETCRTLRTLRRIRSGVSLLPQLDELRANNFAPRVETPDPDKD